MGLRRPLPGLLFLLVAAIPCGSQVIQFESAGLKYHALTRNGLTIMLAPLTSQVRDFAVMQVAVSNGSNATYTIKPEDFLFLREDGAEVPAVPAKTVVSALVDRASRSDVVKLVEAYEAGIYGNMQYRATNGYEHRRLNAMAELGGTRVRAAATASAIAFVLTKLSPGQSTDGAVFYQNAGRPLGPGTVRVRAADAVFEFPMLTSN